MREIDMSTKYDPKEVEPGRYEKWVKDGVFKPSGDKKAKPYSIVIPPPNVTGKLHLGHAWITRYKIADSAKADARLRHIMGSRN